jgi:3-hydroxyacyl-CoA dehydrogenase / enoyl-CoA hydratase / 3-hydroxybutyryl-CoA epimerase
MYIFKAAVVGAGTMGGEIAQVISFSGLPVVLKDVDQAMLDKGMETIRHIYQSRVDKGKMSGGEMESKIALVEPTLTYDSFGDVDVVIEAVPERMAIKKQVFAELDAACPETTIFGSNTSALSISEMGAATRRPGKVIGIHFYNPAHVMKLVEVIPGLDTTQETVDDVVTFAESLRKLPVVVQECPGFLVNRLLGAFLNEASYCLQEGAATATEMDEALREFGMPMGAFILMDTIGLDIAAHAGEEMYAAYGPRMEPPQLMYRLLEAGRLGEKAGKGIYGYGGEEDAPIAELAADLQREGSRFTVERCIYPLINEAVINLQEHIASATDIDIACVAGLGMKYKGEFKGPLAIADEIGLDCVLEELESLHKQYGERFRPAFLLRTKVRAGHLGVKAGRGFHEYA